MCDLLRLTLKISVHHCGVYGWSRLDIIKQL